MSRILFSKFIICFVAQFSKVLEQWKYKGKKFESTQAYYVLKLLQENSSVTITASSIEGETITLQHVACQMHTDGYSILLVKDPGDIVKHYNPNQKTLFVIDVSNQTEINFRDPVFDRIRDILEDKQTKLIVVCR